jgi:hypothetical protein
MSTFSTSQILSSCPRIGHLHRGVLYGEILPFDAQEVLPQAPGPGTHLITPGTIPNLKRVRWVARDRLLTGTCNWQGHPPPLRSSHKLLLEVLAEGGDSQCT